MLEAAVERARGLLRAEVEQELGGGEEEDRAALEDGVVRDVLRDHRLAETLRGDEDDVARIGEEVDGEGAVDDLPVDLSGPCPVEVDHWLEAADVAVRETALEATSDPMLVFDVDDVLEKLCRAPALAGGAGDEIVERVGGGT